MKNTFKRIIPLLASILLVCCVCLGVMACSKPGITEYNITVVYEDDSAVNGSTDGIGGVNPDTGDALTQILVQFCNKESGQCATPVLLGTDGKVTVSASTLKDSIGTGTYQVKLIGLKSNFYYDVAEVSSSNGNAKITVNEYDYCIKTQSGTSEQVWNELFGWYEDAFISDGGVVEGVYVGVFHDVYPENPEEDWYTVTDAAGVTDENGEFWFDLEPQAEVNYSVRLQQYGETGDDTSSAIPNGYESIVTWSTFDVDTKEYVFGFKDITNSFAFAEITKVPYSRVAGETDPVETKEDLTFTINPGEVKYFSFTPYVTPAGVEDDMLASLQAIEAAQRAAAGVYIVQFTNDYIVAQAFNDIQTTWYDNFGTGMPWQLDDSNTNFLSHVDGNGNDDYNAGNYLFYDLDTTRVGKENGFYVTLLDTVTEAQEVTITVERIRDAREKVTNVIDIEMAADAESYADQDAPEGEWTLAPVDGSYDAVLGADGFYRLGSENGPVLYATIVKANSQIANVPFADIPMGDGSGDAPGESAFMYSEYPLDDTINGIQYVRNIYSYYDIICGLDACYANYVNNDGTYPVTEQIKEILEQFAGNFMDSYTAEYGYEWLLACGYYAEQKTVTVPADSANSDVVTTLSAGTWLITLTSTQDISTHWVHVGDPELCDPLCADNNFQTILTVDTDTEIVLWGSESTAIDYTLTFTLTVEPTPELSVTMGMPSTYTIKAGNDGTMFKIADTVMMGEYQITINPGMMGYQATFYLAYGMGMPAQLNASNDFTAVISYNPFFMGNELRIAHNGLNDMDVQIALTQYFAPVVEETTAVDLGVGAENSAEITLAIAWDTICTATLVNVPAGTYNLVISADDMSVLEDADVFFYVAVGEGDAQQLKASNNYSGLVTIGTETYITIYQDVSEPLTFTVTLELVG